MLAPALDEHHNRSSTSQKLDDGRSVHPYLGLMINQRATPRQKWAMRINTDLALMTAGGMWPRRRSARASERLPTTRPTLAPARCRQPDPDPNGRGANPGAGQRPGPDSRLHLRGPPSLVSHEERSSVTADLALRPQGAHNELPSPSGRSTWCSRKRSTRGMDSTPRPGPPDWPNATGRSEARAPPSASQLRSPRPRPTGWSEPSRGAKCAPTRGRCRARPLMRGNALHEVGHISQQRELQATAEKVAGHPCAPTRAPRAHAPPPGGLRPRGATSR